MVVSNRVELIVDIMSIPLTLFPVGADATAVCAIGGICATGATGATEGIGGGM